jgi:hypothetical protein
MSLFVSQFHWLSKVESERSQFCTGGLVVRVKNALNPQTFGDLDKHGSVFNINYLPDWRLGDVQRQPKYLHIGLAELDETGGNKGVHKLIQLRQFGRQGPTVSLSQQTLGSSGPQVPAA